MFSCPLALDKVELSMGKNPFCSAEDDDDERNAAVMCRTLEAENAPVPLFLLRESDDVSQSQNQFGWKRSLKSSSPIIKPVLPGHY